MANQVVTQIIVDSRGAVQGTADWIRKNNEAQRSVDALDDRTAALNQRMEQQTATLTRGANSVSTIARQYRALVASVDPVAAAQQKMGDAVERATLRADAAVRRLGVSSAEAARVVGLVAEKYREQVVAAQAAADSANDNVAANSRLRNQLDPLFAAQSRHLEQLHSIAEAYAQGAISTDVMNAARQRSVATLQQETRALEAAAAARFKAGMSEAGAAGSAAAANMDAGARLGGLSYKGGSVLNDAELAKTRAQYDELFRAEQAYIKEMEALQRALQQTAISQQVYNARAAEQGAILDGVVAKVSGATAAQEAAARAAKELAAAQSAASKAASEAATAATAAQAAFNQQLGVRDDFGTESRAADIAAFGAALDKLQAEFDPVFAATQKYEDRLDRLSQALRYGLVSQESYDRQLAESRAAHEAQVRSLQGIVEAQQYVARSAQEMQRAMNEAGAAGSAAYSRMQANVSAGNRLGSLSYSGGSQTSAADQSATREKYDQVYAAQQEYQRALAVLNADLARGAVTGDVYTAALGRMDTALRKTMTSLGNLSDEQREANRAAEEGARAAQIEKAMQAAGQAAMEEAQAIGKLRAELVPTYGAQLELAAANEKATAAERAGIISKEELGAALVKNQARFNAQTNEIRKAQAANENLNRGVGLSANAWQNLGYQINDVATSLASGISPMQTLAQQGGQVFQILQSGQGGVGGALKAIGQQLLALAAGPVGIFATIAAGLIAAAAAGYQFVAAQNAMKNALLGAGGQAGITAEDLQGVARRASETANITIGSAREIEKAFLQTGGVLGEAFEPLTVAAARISKATGQEMKEVATGLAQNLKNLDAGGLDNIIEMAGKMDVAFVKAVRDAGAMGDELKQQTLIAQKLAETFKQVGENTDSTGRLVTSITTSMSRAWESFGQRVSASGATVQQQIESLQAQIANRKALGDVDSASRGQTYDPSSDSALQALKAREQNLIKQQTETRRIAAESGKTIRDNLTQGEKKIVEQTIPDISRLKTLPTELAKISQAVGALTDAKNEGKAGAAEKLDQVTAAQRRLQQVQADVTQSQGAQNVEEEKAKQVLAARLQALRAVTPEEKASAAAQQSRADAFGTMTSGLERTRAADTAYKEAIAGNTAATDQAIRSSKARTESLDSEAIASIKSGQSTQALVAANKAREQVANGTIRAVDQQRVAEDALASQLVEVRKQQADRVRSMQDEVAATNKGIAAQHNQGQTSEEVRATREKELTLAKLLREQNVGSAEDQAKLAQTIKATGDAFDAQRIADYTQASLTLTEQTKRQIAVMEDEIKHVGDGREAREAASAARQAEQRLLQQAIPLNSDAARSYVEQEVALSKVKTKLDEAREAQQRLNEGQRAIGDAFTSFIDNLVSGSGKLTDALAGLAKTFTSGGLQAIFTGQGPFAEMFGTANKDPQKMGGLFGGITPKGFSDLIKDGTKEGSGEGIMGGFNSIFGTNFDTKKAVGALGGVLSIAGAFGAGAQAKSASGAMLSGAVSGGVGGFMLGSQIGGMAGPIGAVAGAAVGGLLSLFGFNDAKKQRRKEAAQQGYDNYVQNLPQINQFRSVLRGEAQTGREAQIRQANDQLVQATTTAAKGGAQSAADDMVREYHVWANRLRQETRNLTAGIEQDLMLGQGMDGPFQRAASQTKQFAEAIKGFILDAGSALDAASASQAKATAINALVQSIQPTPALTSVQTEMARINGTAAQLRTVLDELGISAADAGAAIDQNVKAAMDTLRKSFDDDIGRKLNDALGKDYINDAADLIKNIGSLREDAARIGANASQVEAYFTAAAQKIIDDAELTGDAFQALVQQFPQLNGRVHEFSEALDAVSSSADIAARKLQYADRYFAAMTDTSTLQGQLATFDRQAAKDRADEVKAGGQALVELERAQAAERANIYISYYQQQQEQMRQAQTAARQEAENDLRSAYQAESSALQTTIDRLKSFTVAIKQFRESLLTNQTTTTLDPNARFLEAQRQFQATAAAALGGDETAQGQLQQMAQAYLDSARAYYASSTDYARAFDQVQDVLKQVETSGTKQADVAQQQLLQLRTQVSRLISIDDGIKTVAEAIAKLQSIGSGTVGGTGSGPYGMISPGHYTRDWGTNPARNLAIDNDLKAAGIAYTGDYGNGRSLAWANALTDPAQKAKALQIIGSHLDITRNFGAVPGRNQALVDALRSAGLQFIGDFGSGAYTAWQQTLSAADQQTERAIFAKFAGMNYQQGGMIPMMAGGGMVGNGSWNRDSVLARFAGGGHIGLAGGEYVTPAPMTQRYLPELQAMRNGTYRPANSNTDMGTRMMVAELRRLAQIVAAAGAMTTQAVQENGERASRTESLLRKVASK